MDEPDHIRRIREEVVPYEPGDGPIYQGNDAEIAIPDLLEYADELRAENERLKKDLKFQQYYMMSDEALDMLHKRYQDKADEYQAAGNEAWKYLGDAIMDLEQRAGEVRALRAELAAAKLELEKLREYKYDYGKLT